MSSDKFSPGIIVFNNYSRIWGNKRWSNMDIILADPNDSLTWIVRVRDISGSNDEFKGGEFLIQLKATDDPTKKPPNFKFLTPNGLYTLGSEDVCISIGKYHSSSYAPAQGGMGGFATQMVDILVSWKDMSPGVSFLHNDYFYKIAKHPIKDDSLESARNIAQFRKEVRVIEKDIYKEISEFSQKSQAYNLNHYPDYIRRLNAKPLNKLYERIEQSNYPTKLKNTMLKFITPD